MTPRAIAFGAALLAAACGRGPASPAASPAAATVSDEVRRFRRIMEANDVDLSGLQSEAAHDAGRERYLVRLRSIRSRTPEAMSLRVRISDEEQAELKREFLDFLKALDGVESDPWLPAAAVATAKRLEAACSHCHTRFR